MFGKLFSSKAWSLHNPLKQWTLHQLTWNELQKVVQTLSPTEVCFSVVWKKGWAEWQKLKDNPDLIKPLDVKSLEVPPIPQHLLETTEDDITQVKLMQASPSRAMGRRHQRYNVSIPVEIVRGEQSFKTTTIDVSESGVRFVEDLPEWVAGYFTIIFDIGGAIIEVTAALVEDQKNVKNRAEIIDTNDEESGLDIYLAWVRSLN
jgi:hypothetical protein